MPNMTKQEKTVIIFLLLTALTGFLVLEYKNFTQRPVLKVEQANLTKEESSAEEIIKQQKIVDINQADLKLLCSLSGIGPKLAEQIIEHRNKNGPFKTKQDLMNVKGIGKKKFKQIEEFITL